jgi:hypothetical protein
MQLRTVACAVAVTLVSASEIDAATKCSADVSKGGAIAVKATKVASNPRWSGSLGTSETAPFVNAATCFKSAELKECALGAVDTLAAITPPATCMVCVSDDGPDDCCAFVKGCTPGIRLRDGSFPADDPRLESIERVGTGRTLRFTGVNVQVVDGTGETDGPVTGLGNLIIGYAEDSGDRNDRDGSHNLIVGPEHTWTSFGGLVAGFENAIRGEYSTVSGGGANVATGRRSAVHGGNANVASARYAAICGGQANAAGEATAVVPFDRQPGDAPSVAGGAENVAIGTTAAVGAGFLNRAEGETSSVSGGRLNVAEGLSAAIAGGDRNIARGVESTILGGEVNETTALAHEAAVVGGRRNTVREGNAVILGGDLNEAHSIFSAIVGGTGNQTFGINSTIAGGLANVAFGRGAAVSGGRNNGALGNECVVGGGEGNIAFGPDDWVVGTLFEDD